MSTHYFHNVDEAYQITLKVEEKLSRRSQQNFKGKGPRGKGRTSVARGTRKKMKQPTAKIQRRKWHWKR
jgi:hypothetical protein